MNKYYRAYRLNILDIFAVFPPLFFVFIMTLAVYHLHGMVYNVILIIVVLFGAAMWLDTVLSDNVIAEWKLEIELEDTLQVIDKEYDKELKGRLK